MQLGENESALGNACPWLLNLDHSPIWTIPSTLYNVQPGENESSLGNDYLDHFLMKWLSCTNIQNRPFFETAHNCELQNNDCPVRQTSFLDHYWEWLPRKNIVLDHSPTLATRGIVVYGTSTIYRTIFITKMTIRFGLFSELETECPSEISNHFPNWKGTSHPGPFFELKNDCP